MFVRALCIYHLNAARFFESVDSVTICQLHGVGARHGGDRHGGDKSLNFQQKPAHAKQNNFNDVSNKDRPLSLPQRTHYIESFIYIFLNIYVTEVTSIKHTRRNNIVNFLVFNKLKEV
jgi:hypothetical protein